MDTDAPAPAGTMPPSPPPLRVDRIIGNRLDAALAGTLHHLAHHGAIDLLRLDAADLKRRRLQATTERGRLVQIALPRSETLADGAVLAIDAQGAVVVRVRTQSALRLAPRDAADALALGYHAGNLHWAVRFEGPVLVVPLDAPADLYLARLGDLAARLDVAVVDA